MRRSAMVIKYAHSFLPRLRPLLFLPWAKENETPPENRCARLITKFLLTSL